VSDPDDTATPSGQDPQDHRERAVPGQLPGDPAASPVPAPGAAAGASSPGVRAAQGPSPADGVHAGEKSEDSDASVTSPGAWTAAAAPGKPDGEVDTRAR
jgi:hypothetical protein